VEQIADHVNAAVLDISGLRIFLIIDKVLGKGLCHELLGFIFLKRVLVKLFRNVIVGSFCQPSQLGPRNGSVSAGERG